MKYSVDIEAGNAFVERLKVKAPKIGGFNGMVRVPSGHEKPVPYLLDSLGLEFFWRLKTDPIRRSIRLFTSFYCWIIYTE